ncbi:MAG: hypothetical protein U0Y68_14625 [Blastocatellia bacterium]
MNTKNTINRRKFLQMGARFWMLAGLGGLKMTQAAAHGLQSARVPVYARRQ